MGAADANVNSLSADDVALASVKPRIESARPDAVSDDDFDTDAEGRAILKATPPIKRTTMFPEARRTNPVARFGILCWGVRRTIGTPPKRRPRPRTAGALSVPCAAMCCWC